MHPVLFHLELGPRELVLGSYGACMSLAILVGALGTLWSARRARLELGAVVSAIGLCIAAGFAGAYGMHTGVQWWRLGTLSEALATPGIAVYGALIAGAAMVMVSGRALGVRPIELLELAAPFVALAQAVGRLGCLLGGCCYGLESSSVLAVRYDHPLAPAHADFARVAVPLYEALLLVGIALVLVRIRRSRPYARLFVYAVLYACVRLSLEPLRADALRGSVLGLSTAQLVSLLVLFTCAGYAAARLQVQRLRA